MNTRPTAITVICILGFIGSALSVLGIMAVSAAMALAPGKIPSFLLPWMIVSTIVGLISLIGYWMMKKWGVLLYTSFFVINQIILVATHNFGIFGLIIPLIVVGIGFANFNNME